MLNQALLVIAPFADPSPAFADYVGPHLRHVIEHYSALLTPLLTSEKVPQIEYDARVRDRSIETSPNVARGRIRSLQGQLSALTDLQLHTPVTVHLLGGAAGEAALAVPSTVARELMFVASHAVHHFALVARYCQQNAIATPVEFGMAPATIAHARAQTLAYAG
jgi:hypothetical protein